MNKRIIAVVLVLSLMIPMKAEARERLYIPDEVIHISEQIAPQYGFTPQLVQAVCWVESRCNPEAINKSCVGIMQINMNVWDEMVTALDIENMYEPTHNIIVGCEILKGYFDKTGDLYEALVKYNGSSDYAKTVLAIKSYLEIYDEKTGTNTRSIKNE